MIPTERTATGVAVSSTISHGELATMLALLANGLSQDAVARRTNVHPNTLKYRLKVLRQRLCLSDVAPVSEIVAAAVTQGWIADRRTHGRDELTVFMAYLEAGLPPGPIGVGIRTYLEARFATWRPELLARDVAA